MAIQGILAHKKPTPVGQETIRLEKKRREESEAEFRNLAIEAQVTSLPLSRSLCVSLFPLLPRALSVSVHVPSDRGAGYEPPLYLISKWWQVLHSS